MRCCVFIFPSRRMQSRSLIVGILSGLFVQQSIFHKCGSSLHYCQHNREVSGAWSLPLFPKAPWLFRELSTVSLLSFVFSPRLFRFTEQLMPFSSSISFLSSLQPFRHTPNTHSMEETNRRADPSQFPSPLLFPQTPTSPLLFSPPFFPSSPSPSVPESTGGSSRYMCSQLLCGHHDNHHEFNMVLTYPGGCEAVWMQRFKWRSHI